jgi:hypothetical protein
VDDTDDATKLAEMKPRNGAKKLPLICTGGQEKRIQALVDKLSLLIDSCNSLSAEEWDSIAVVLDDAQDDFELVGDDECSARQSRRRMAGKSGSEYAWKVGHNMSECDMTKYTSGEKLICIASSPP